MTYNTFPQLDEPPSILSVLDLFMSRFGDPSVATSAINWGDKIELNICQTEEILEPGVVLLEMVQGLVDDAHCLRAIHLKLWMAIYPILTVSTVIGARMSHWKWRETKRQPSRARSGRQISCCLVSLHFLCDILAPITVQGQKFWWGKQGVSGVDLKYRATW